MSVDVAFVTRRQDLLHRDLPGASAQRLDAGHRRVDLDLALIDLGHQPGDRPAMTGDEDDLAAFDLAKEMGQMGFGLGGLDLTHEL